MEPIYADRHRITLGDLFNGVLVVWVFFIGATGSPVWLILALAFAAFLAFTRHRRYELTSTELVVKFLGPRELIVPLADITGADLVKMPMSGVALVLMRERGLRVLLTPVDADRFLQELRAVLGR